MYQAEPTKSLVILSACSLKSAPKLSQPQDIRCQMMIRLCTLSRGSKRPRRLVQRKLLAFPNKLQLRKICEVREK
ncbi:hypothetical protein A262_24657 [Pseudomonas syringae pv. actinidiae ICMP 19073]|nr:hypothetical protein A262_24657 [Pseudomonas syringae pv. actinidiae ICMP 19073]